MEIIMKTADILIAMLLGAMPALLVGITIGAWPYAGLDWGDAFVIFALAMSFFALTMSWRVARYKEDMEGFDPTFVRHQSIVDSWLEQERLRIARERYETVTREEALAEHGLRPLEGVHAKSAREADEAVASDWEALNISLNESHATWRP